jgi:hypothetical protein
MLDLGILDGSDDALLNSLPDDQRVMLAPPDYIYILERKTHQSQADLKVIVGGLLGSQ